MPTDLEGREQRIRLLAEAAAALCVDAPVHPAAASLLGRALATWLQAGGDLEQHLGVRGPPGSHITPAALARRVVIRGLLPAAERAPAKRLLMPTRSTE